MTRPFAAEFAANRIALSGVALLSLVRRPADFFTFNPWLQRLPDYLGSSEGLSAKLAFLSHLTVAGSGAAVAFVALAGVETAWLQEHRVRRGDLPDVVQKGRLADEVDLDGVHPHRPSEEHP